MKLVLVSPKNNTAYNFRGDLIKEIINNGYDVIVTGPDYKEVDKITDLGAKFKLLPSKNNNIKPFQDILYFFRLYRLFIKEKPDIVLSYTIKPVIFGSIAAKMAKIKNVNAMITGIGYVFLSKSIKSFLLKFLVTSLYKTALKSISNVIFQNSDDMNFFINKRMVINDVCKVVNGSGVNLDFFRPTHLPKKISFLMVSRILFNKGIKEYIEASKIIKTIHPNVTFNLLGEIERNNDSFDYSLLKPFIEDEIIDYFTYSNDVRHYYENCSIFVLPSYGEGLPRSILEAMAMNRPIITTDVPGCRETVINNVNGFLVKPKNVLSLVDAMMKYIENPHLIERHGYESLKYCRLKFDVKNVNIQMLNYLGIKKPRI
jgi:glycosyltransferase involved in cell wall biosynthesis